MQAGEHMLWKGSRYTQPDIQINVPTVLTDTRPESQQEGPKEAAWVDLLGCSNGRLLIPLAMALPGTVS